MAAPGDSVPRTEVVSASLAILGPRTSFGPDSRDTWAMVWLLSGRATVTTAGRTWSLVPGDVHLIPPNLTSYFEWDPEHTIREASVLFRCEGSLDWPRYRNFTPGHPVPVLLSHVLWLSEERPDGWEAARDHALGYALRAFIYGYHGTAPTERVPEPIERVVAHMQRQWDLWPLTSPSLVELAAASGVTESHLCALFKSFTGVGPVRAFRLLRIEHAAALLVQTNLTVAQVARQTGFVNEHHFSRLFHSVVGVSPTGFRSRPAPRFDLPSQFQPLATRMSRPHRAYPVAAAEG